MESMKYYVEYQPIITKELGDNYGHNEIFVINTNGSFGSLIRTLQSGDPNDILFVLGAKDVFKYTEHSIARNEEGNIIMQYGTPLAEQFFEHLVAVLFMAQLKAKYGIPTTHDLEDELKCFTEESVRDYLKQADSLVSRKDVFDAIEGLNMRDTRLHIVLRVSMPELFKELSYYMQEEYPFITMLYTTNDRLVPRDGCRYRRFVSGQQVEDTYPKTVTKIKTEGEGKR